MKKRWLLLAGVVGVFVGAAVTVLAYLWARDLNVPEWAKANSGPWVAFGAFLALLGVLIGTGVSTVLSTKDRRARTAEATLARSTAVAEAKADREHQAEQARQDRENAARLADEQRRAQEARAQREWYREKQFEAVLDAMKSTGMLLLARARKEMPQRELNDAIVEFATANQIAATLIGTSGGPDLLTRTQAVAAKYSKMTDDEFAKPVGEMQQILLVAIRRFDGRRHKKAPVTPPQEVKEEAEGQ